MSGLLQAGVRRIVTYIDAQGRSRIAPGDRAPRVTEYPATPGLRTSVLWATAGKPDLADESQDPVPDLASMHPVPGATSFLTLTVPPDCVYMSPDFDTEQAIAEQIAAMPGIVDRMEPDAPGFHRTDTLDYVILLAGELWLVVDDDETHLTPGDIVIQIGARHAWQNRSEDPATLAVVMLGAEPRSVA